MAVPTPFAVEWLERRLRPEVVGQARTYRDAAGVRFVVERRPCGDLPESGEGATADVSDGG